MQLERCFSINAHNYCTSSLLLFSSCSHEAPAYMSRCCTRRLIQTSLYAATLLVQQNESFLSQKERDCCTNITSVICGDIFLFQSGAFYFCSHLVHAWFGDVLSFLLHFLSKMNELTEIHVFFLLFQRPEIQNGRQAQQKEEGIQCKR